jgi:hypothetical protein
MNEFPTKISGKLPFLCSSHNCTGFSKITLHRQNYFFFSYKLGVGKFSVKKEMFSVLNKFPRFFTKPYAQTGNIEEEY